MKKRITAKDWTFIGKLNYAAKWCKPLCSYYLEKETTNTFKRTQKIGWFMYVLLFVPVHILQMFVLLWDGGLKEFIILERSLGSDYLFSNTESFKRAEEIWAKYPEIGKDIDN